MGKRGEKRNGKAIKEKVGYRNWPKGKRKKYIRLKSKEMKTSSNRRKLKRIKGWDKAK